MSEQEKQPDNQTTQPPLKEKEPAVKFYVSEVRSFLSLF